MHKSLKLASIVLATATIVYAAGEDQPIKQFALQGNIGTHTLGPQDGDNPGTILDASGSRGNINQSYTAVGLEFVYMIGQTGNFEVHVGVDYQPTKTAYANPTGNISAGTSVEHTGTLTLNSVNISANGASSIADASKPSGTALVTNDGTDDTTVTLTADSGGKQSRENSTIYKAAVIYNINDAVGLGINYTQGTSDHVIGTLASKQVKESSFGGQITLSNPGNGFGLTYSVSLLGEAQADVTTDGTNKEKMFHTSTMVSYRVDF